MLFIHVQTKIGLVAMYASPLLLCSNSLLQRSDQALTPLSFGIAISPLYRLTVSGSTSLYMSLRASVLAAAHRCSWSRLQLLLPK